MEEAILLLITFLFAIIAGITGIGIATIIIPLLLLVGWSFPFSKAAALWVNLSIMSLSVFKRFKYIKWNLALPLVLSAFIAAPLGAKFSFLLPERLQLLLLATFVAISAFLILFLKPKPRVSGLTHYGFIKIGLLLGFSAGFLGGMLGIGGGILANPVLIILGFDPFEVTSISAFMVLLSSFSGWVAYTYMGYFKASLGLPLFLAAAGGSYIGVKLSEKFDRKTVRKLVAYFALFVSFITYLKAFTI